MFRCEREEGIALAIEVCGNKETNFNVLPISLEHVHGYSPNIDRHNQDDRETSESDGLEDLWKDMSVAMECSKVLFLCVFHYLTITVRSLIAPLIIFMYDVCCSFDTILVY